EDSTVVLVTGGSQGSRAINEAVLSALSERANEPASARNVEILWAAGPNNIESINARLPGSARSWVKTHGYISNMPGAMAASDVAISRAGAMATAELLAWGIPMVLIPLPTAAADHQAHNARALANAGAAVMLEERALTPELLWDTLTNVVSDVATRERMRVAALERARPNAAREIAAKLAQLL
ncbi:MAG TPA: UDP-N-acetylglucosamine--N-acetylmuramyl-(pentapeptide) pyrophosphoryl-undecaprenol N-acetylglucosamine transferase, partial [Longimicrobiales bacterium]